MSAESIEREFRDRVSEQITLSPEGIDRYRVLTPFMLEDGDHLVVVLKREGAGWILTDEGHTYMHLTYDIDGRDLERGTRQVVIANALSSLSVEDREGQLVLPVPDGRYGDALYSFVQAQLKISDITYLSRERVRSTFLEDFRAFMEARVPSERIEFDWHDPERDPEGNYVVDSRVNGSPRPLFVYALPSDGKVRDATIYLHQFERWGFPFRSLAIFEDQAEINRKVLARFSDVCEKQFSSLTGNKERIEKFLQGALTQ
jgi:hypothetical protein